MARPILTCLPAFRLAPAAALAGLVAMAFSSSTAASGAPRSHTSQPSVTRIVLSADRTKLMAGETATLQAKAYDAQGGQLQNPRLAFRSSSAAARVSSSGIVTGVRFGTAEIWAAAGKVTSNHLTFDVNQVAQVIVTPGTPQSLHQGETETFQASATDPRGATIPNVPITWRSSKIQVASINDKGGLRATATGTTQVVASAGKVKSKPVQVTVGPRAQSKATRVFLHDAPSDDFRSVFITIAKIEVQATDGTWLTLLTKEQIDAMVGQPIDVLKLKNLKEQLGTVLLPNGEYQAARLTVSTAADANYVIDHAGTRIALHVPEANAASEWPLKFTVVDGKPTNLVIDFLVNRSIQEGNNGELTLEPDCQGDEEGDHSAEEPIGAIVGQVTLAMAGEVVAVRTDGSPQEAQEEEGKIDPKTGAFRVEGLAPGTYALHVKGHAGGTSGIVVMAGQDTKLAQPIPVGAPSAGGA